MKSAKGSSPQSSSRHTGSAHARSTNCASPAGEPQRGGRDLRPKSGGSRALDPSATCRKVVPMLTGLLVSLGVVFVAELGDKSQLMTMTYALRHRWWVVLSGVAIAAFLVHGLSVLVVHFLGLSLPARPIAFVAAIAFFGFAAWTW